MTNQSVPAKYWFDLVKFYVLQRRVKLPTQFTVGPHFVTKCIFDSFESNKGFIYDIDSTWQQMHVGVI